MKLHTLIIISILFPLSPALLQGKVSAVEATLSPIKTIRNSDPLQHTDTLQQVTVRADMRLEAVERDFSVQTTRLSGSRLNMENRLNYKDISVLVPNLFIPEYGSRMTSSIYMRGLGSRIDNPAVGMYMDGVPVCSKNAFDQDISDLKSVEVFRGPQGTLFGKNTIGGVISMRTLSPLEYQGLRAEVGVGNGGGFSTRISNYGKISNGLGLAIGADLNHSDGFYWNEGRGESCDAGDDFSTRVKVEKIGKGGSLIKGLVSFSHVDQRGFPYHRPDEAIAYNDYAGYLRNLGTAALTYSVERRGLQLENTLSYQILGDRMDMDQDYTTLSYFTLQQKQAEHCLTDELTVKPSERKGRWSWISGLSARWKHNRMSAPVTFKEDGISNLILANANKGIANMFPDAKILIEEDEFPIGSDFRTSGEDLGLFHTSFFDFGPVRLEAGLRLEMEHIGFRYDSESLIHYMFTATMKDWKELVTSMPGKESMTYVEPLPRISVSYRKDFWKAYASVSEGYRAGGYNTQLFSDILQNRMMNGMMHGLGVYLENAGSEYEVSEVISYKPERCWSFEAGGSIDRRFGKMHLIADAAIFDIETVSQQLTVFPEKGTGRYMTNAGRSRSLGAEFTLKGIAGNFSMDLSGGLTDARFIRYASGGNDYSGNHVPYSPSGTFSASAAYRVPIEGRLFSSISFAVSEETVGRIWWNEENDVWQYPYSRLGGSIRLQMKKFAFTLWGRNLTDTRYDTFWFKSMGKDFLQNGKPITYGIKLNIEL